LEGCTCPFGSLSEISLSKMSDIKKAAQNSLVLSIGSIFNRIFEIVSIFLLVSYLSTDDFGRYTAIFVYVSIGALFIDLGMSSILQRECARNDKIALELMQTGFLFGLGMSIIVVIASYIVLGFLDYPEEVKNLFWYAIFAVLVSSRFKSFRRIFDSLFIVNFKVKYITFFNVLDRILFMIGVGLIVRLSHSVIHAVLLTVVVDALGTFLLITFYTKNFGFPIRSLKLLRPRFLLSESWPLLLTSGAYIINLRIDILIITGMVSKGILTESDIGLYRFGSLIPEAMSFIPFAISTPLFPILSKKFTVDKKAFLNAYKLTVKYLMFIALPVIMYLFIEIDEIMQLLVNFSLNEDYIQSIPVIRILLFSQVFVFGYVAFSTVMKSSDNQRLNFMIALISAVSNIALNYLLIPPFGIRGAAFATLVSYGLFTITALFFPRSRVYSWELLLSMRKPCVAAVVMGGVLYATRLNMWLSLFFGLVGLVIYIVVFTALKGFDKQDFEIFDEIYPNRFVNRIQKFLF